ncbi:hypothetical protein [Myroides pelagicus]|uniref:Uncharacterized protein n=1 Tax=Myroides pelagicus TaxID=270914 RepID=A0A7K1GL24_9FLAO|nr:hypothetical protein [Myroides pelagicus]MEC4113898.1 hypothetical protein [Myroides pelagicus]MTH29133.1 hypothetical protein [Myroides pelagicus]
MKLPIELKESEFVVLVTVDIDPKYKMSNADQFYNTLPKSFKPIFKKAVGSTLRVYCVCNNEDDFMFCLRQTGYKTTLL